MYVKLVILIFVLLNASILSSADLFSYYVGRELDTLSAVQTPKAETILAGRVYVNGQNFDASLVKINSSGTIEWKTRLGGNKYEQFDGVVALKDGTYVAVGSTTTFVEPQPYVASDLLIVRFEESGKILWRKTIGATGDDRAVSATATFDGGIVILVDTNSFGDPDPFLDTYNDFLIIKLNASGEIQWSLNLAVRGEDHAISSIGLKDGSIIVGGYGFENKLMLSRINQTGKILWTRKLNELFIFRAMTQLQDGNILISAGEHDLTGNSVLTKINPSGIVLWSKRITSNNEHVDVSALLADDSGGAFVAGLTSDDTTLFLRINKQGAVQWKKAFDIGNGEDPRKMLKLSNGRMIFVGGAYDFRWSYRTVIVGFTKAGEMQSCYSEVPTVQLTGIKVHSEKFSILPERNLRFRITSPRLIVAEPNLPKEEICP